MGWLSSRTEAPEDAELGLAFLSGVGRGSQNYWARVAIFSHAAYLRQCSDGRDPSLALCCLDSVATGAASGELKAGTDH